MNDMTLAERWWSKVTHKGTVPAQRNLGTKAVQDELKESGAVLIAAGDDSARAIISFMDDSHLIISSDPQVPIRSFCSHRGVLAVLDKMKGK